MKQIFAILVFVSFLNTGFAEDSAETQGKPAGLLSFSKQIPLELDEENNKILEDDQLAQIKRNAIIFHQKRFPLGNVLLGLLAGLTLLSIWTYSKTQKRITKDPVKTAKAQAIEALDDFKNTADSTSYNQLIDILREYIENGYQIKIKAKTTDEFLDEMKTYSLPENFPKAELEYFLTFADLVKFAKAKPTQDDIDKAHTLVKNIIFSSLT